LAYDIIKAHGGEIKLETKEGEESKFIIYLLLGNSKIIRGLILCLMRLTDENLATTKRMIAMGDDHPFT